MPRAGSGGAAPEGALRVLVVSAMYPRTQDVVKGLPVLREVEWLRARSCTVEVIGKAPGWRAYAGQARRALRALQSDFDVVHAHYGTSAFVAACARLLARGRRPPLVVTLHGSDVANGPRPRLSRYWLQYCLSCLGCLGARRVIVQDEAMLSVLPKPIRRRAQVLGQAVDPTRFPAAVKRDMRLVLFLSDRHRPVKRFWLSEEALSKATAPELRLESLDDYDVEEIPRAMARAGLGLLTSEREGMPVAVKEALAAGLRVLAVDLAPLRRIAAAVPELVTLVPADGAELGRAIDRLVATPPPTERERASALMSLRELGWTEPSRTDRLLEIYEGVAGASPGTAAGWPAKRGGTVARKRRPS